MDCQTTRCERGCTRISNNFLKTWIHSQPEQQLKQPPANCHHACLDGPKLTVVNRSAGDHGGHTPDSIITTQVFVHKQQGYPNEGKFPANKHTCFPFSPMVCQSQKGHSGLGQPPAGSIKPCRRPRWSQLAVDHRALHQDDSGVSQRAPKSATKAAVRS